VRTRDDHLFAHGGDNPGFHSICEVSTRTSAGFVMVTDGDNGAELVKKLAPAVSTVFMRQRHERSDWREPYPRQREKL
jgi:hypothetical protein